MADDNHEIRTYHYLDERLVDRYHAQFSAPVTYDKVTAVSTALSIIGPSVTVNQNKAQRALTIYERIDQLAATLASKGKVGRDRFRGANNDPDEKRAVFRIETCRARRIVLNAEGGAPVASLWVSRQGPKGWLSLLLLVENNQDKNPEAEFYSQFSHLAIVLMSLSPRIMDLPPFSQAAHLYRQKREKDFTEFTDAITEELVADPVGFLRSAGAQILPERNISCFYWVRLAFSVGFEIDGCRVTVGYPLYIADAEGEGEKDKGKWGYHNNVGAIGYCEAEIAEHSEAARKSAIDRGLPPDEAGKEAAKARDMYREIAEKQANRKPRLQRMT